MLRSTAYQPLPPSPPPHNRSPFHYSPLSPLPSSLGLFPHPPAPATFQATDELQLLRDLLSIEPIIILNAAMCRRHLAKCPPSAELERECAKAKALEAEFDDRMAKLLENLPDPCQNLHQKCEEWAMAGECAKNPSYMMTTCIKACGFCNPRADGVVVVETDKHGLDREQVAGRAQDVPLARIRGERDGDGFTVDDYDGGRADEEPTVSVAQDEATIARLLVRCRESAPTWTAHEVTECVELARCVFMCCVWTLGDEWMRPAPPLRAHVLTPPHRFSLTHSRTHTLARGTRQGRHRVQADDDDDDDDDDGNGNGNDHLLHHRHGHHRHTNVPGGHHRVQPDAQGKAPARRLRLLPGMVHRDAARRRHGGPHQQVPQAAQGAPTPRASERPLAHASIAVEQQCSTALLDRDLRDT